MIKIHLQADRDFLEALYEKREATPISGEIDILLKHFLQREPTGESLMELMDLVRRYPEPFLMLQVLAHAMCIPAAPKEALWLCETLLLQSISADERAIVEKWRTELGAKRASGTEAYH